jgi:hypothetical protein
MLSRALQNFRETTKGPYEVIVVSDFEPPPSPRVHWCNSTGKAKGPIATQAIGLEHATGEFVLAMADDAEVSKEWDAQAISDHTILGHGQETAGVPFILALRFDLIGTCFGMLYANFPFMRRTTAQALGWYDPAFKLGFGDCDMSMRCWDRGGKVAFTRHRALRVLDEDRRKGATVADPADLRLFTQRWASKFGKGWDCSRLDLFNFNLKLSPSQIAAGSFCCNDANQFFAEDRGWTPLLIEERHNARENIVAYAGKRYVVPQALGGVDLSDPAVRNRLILA